MPSNKIPTQKVQTRAARRTAILDALRGELAVLPPGSRLPGGRELAARYEVSYMTMTRLLDELLVNDEIVRIHGKGTFTAQPSLKTIYFLMPCPAAMIDFETVFLDGALYQARKSGVELRSHYISLSNRNFDIDWRNMERLPEHAAVIVGCVWYKNVFALLNRKHCQVAMIDMESEDMRALSEQVRDWHLVRVGRRRAVAEAVALFRQHDRKRIMLVHHGCHVDNPVRSAFREALSGSGTEFDDKLELYSTMEYQATRESFQSFISLGYPFDGILTAYAVQAVAIYDVLVEAGIKVPQEVAILSLEDNRLLEANAVPISAVTLDYFTPGVEAVKLLLANSRQSLSRDVPFQVFLRKSL